MRPVLTLPKVAWAACCSAGGRDRHETHAAVDSTIMSPAAMMSVVYGERAGNLMVSDGKVLRYELAL